MTTAIARTIDAIWKMEAARIIGGLARRVRDSDPLREGGWRLALARIGTSVSLLAVYLLPRTLAPGAKKNR